MSFLSELSHDVLASGIPLEETMFVLPNRRAQRMLLKSLAAEVGRPVFSPKVCSIDEFVETLSPLRKAGTLEQWVQLLMLYREKWPGKDENLERFQTWAAPFLKDISEIDMQMADGEGILKDLASAKTFEIPFGQDDLDPDQKESLDLYQMLADLYLSYREYLKNQGLAYDGLLYRDCAEHISEYAGKLTHSHYVFAGFHVLTPSELAVVQYVKEHFDTRFYFDVDPFYCDFRKDARFSTSYFLRKICSTLSLPEEKIKFTTNSFATQPKRIRIVGTSQSMNQLYYAVECLEEIRREQGNLNDTALVFADESLLLPFLTTYDVLEANVTMGYPLAATPAYALMDTLLDACLSCRRYSLQAGGRMVWHYRDVLDLIRNPYVQRYLFESPVEFQETVSKLENYQHSTLYDVTDFADGLLPVFPPEDADVPAVLADYLERILQQMEASWERDSLSVLVEVIRQTDELLRPLASHTRLPFHLIRFAICQQTEALTLPTRGDATQGLQVMGLLETRTLDFKNVIMLSVNEGVLPAGISFSSLIPFDFKFNGETLENFLYKDQVYAYHFYRLLQRAENVVLLYDNASTDSLVEKSRFISQLEFEVKEQKLDNITIEYPVVAFPFQLQESETISVKKNDEVMEQLKAFEYSASALKVYINCPLQFYLKHLCKLHKAETFNSRIESNLIGSVVHALFEQIFNDIKKNPAQISAILEEGVEQVDARIRHLLLEDEKFRRDFRLQIQASDLECGRMYLAVQMIRNDVIQYLQKAKMELMNNSISILGNELKLSCRMQVGNNKQELTLKGTIDRLQKEDNHLVVVDYKTGRVDPAKLKAPLDSLKDVFANPDYEQFIQLVFYAILCRYAKHPDLPDPKTLGDPRCTIISIRDVNRNKPYQHPAVVGTTMKGNRLVDVTEFLSTDILDKLEEALKRVLAELIDPTTRFEQTSDVGHCRYCDFKHICKR